MKRKKSLLTQLKDFSKTTIKGKYEMSMKFENMVRCNNCMKIFHENEIIYNEREDKEFCPYCGVSGCLMDVKEMEE